MRKFISIILVILLVASVLTGCKKEVNQLAKPRKGETIAEIVVQNYGTIKVKFFEEAAPKAVENFITHAKKGYYDGQTFYRIIENSMIESGDPTGTGNGGESIWGKSFDDEFNEMLQPYRGALCMANSGPDTNQSQFFIVQASQTYNDTVLDQIAESYNIEFNEKARKLYGKVGGAPWYYKLNTVFGQVYKGYDVLDKISKVKKVNKEQGIPGEEVVIEKVIIKKVK
jgi:Peptidyl-prolyl cis-trans isomerase (rotamase) - cyclophilin family